MKRRTVIALLTAMIVAVPSWAADERAPLPPDLDAVPSDALAFVHLRIADIWKSESLKGVRESIAKAGEKAIAGFDKRFLPAPSSIDRLTVVVFPRGAGAKDEMGVCAILFVNKPFERSEFLKSALPAAVEKKAAGGSYWVDAGSEIAVSFIQDSMIVFGNVTGVQRFVEKRASGPRALTDALQAASANRHVTIGVNISMIPAKEIDAAPPQVRPLLAAKTSWLSFDLTKNSQIDLILNFADEQAAEAGMKSAAELAKLGREFVKQKRQEMRAAIAGDGTLAPLDKLPEMAAMLAGLGALERFDAFLAAPPIKRDRLAVKASTIMPTASMAPLAVAAGLAAWSTEMYLQEAKEAKAALQVKALDTAVKAYKLKNDKFPETLDDLLKAKPFIENADLLTDPWGRKYQYDPKGRRHNGEQPDIWALTPENKTIGNWTEKK
jgi:Type II secretion system (T2SS), protein G